MTKITVAPLLCHYCGTGATTAAQAVISAAFSELLVITCGRQRESLAEYVDDVEEWSATPLRFVAYYELPL